ncbi:MAG TPA: LTA synthase family protein [Planctomycetota bacterium]|nr:LTA synthase family protein [Planctomycetota bacterium]
MPRVVKDADAPSPLPPPPRWPRRVVQVLNPFTFALVVTGLHFAAFGIARLAILLFHANDFSSLSAVDVLRAFVLGLRFDASAIFPVIGVPIFLILLPVKGPLGIRWRQGWGWVCYGLLASFLVVLTLDALYYGTVHRHAGLEATEPREVLKVVAASVSVQAAVPLLGLIAALGLLLVGWRRLLRREPRPWGRPAAQVAAALGLAVFMYFGERGTLSGKRLRVVHAFQNASLEGANLALNGPYCILHTLVHAHAVRSAFYPWPEALREAQGAILTAGERVPDPEYPLLRTRAARDAGKPNIVVILLESWDASATDSHRREMGLPPLGCTPNYDAAAREGVLFSRFYACGQRSMDGLSATLCGFPSLPGNPYLGRGLEQSSLTGLGHLGRKEGYETWLFTSPERDSFRTDAIAVLTGFEHFLGAEDIPGAPPIAPREVLHGPCWDHEMFAEAVRRLTASKRPFLAFLYTGSTHHPFFWPEERWAKRSPATLENRYLNSLEYGDWALGQFFKAAKELGWYDRTIFIVTSDHTGGPGYGLRREDPSTLHHIPGLVIAPGHPSGVVRRIASQLDVLPTIVDLAGWSTPQAALGSSLFADPAPGRGALCVQGSLVLRVEERGFVLHSLDDRVAAEAEPGSSVDAIERRLLSVIQAAYTLLRENRLARRE